MNYVDAAFGEWAEHDGATYAGIAARALEADRTEVGDAATR